MKLRNTLTSSTNRMLPILTLYCKYHHTVVCDYSSHEIFHVSDILLAYHVRENSGRVTPDEATASHQGEAEDASGDTEEEGDDGEGDVRREGEVVIHPEKEQH